MAPRFSRLRAAAQYAGRRAANRFPHYNNPASLGLPGADEQAVPQMGSSMMTVKMISAAADAREPKHGEQLFLANCSPCHGTGGAGNGSVVHLLLHKPANLMTGVSKNLPDGYIYGYIRNGGIWMPSYNDAMSSNERWQVVVYLRDLQANYHGADASAAATPPDTSSNGTAPSSGSGDAG